MQYVITSLCLILICVSGTFSQSLQGEQATVKRYVVVPREIALPVIVSQPDSPLQFENVKYLAKIGGGGGPCFQLRNRSSKPIRTVSFAVLLPPDGGWLDSWPGNNSGAVVMPGQTVPLSRDEGQGEVIPLTKELRNKLKIREPMKVVAILMVVRVQFVDGTTYDDESTYNALQNYFDKINGGNRSER